MLIGGWRKKKNACFKVRGVIRMKFQKLLEGGGCSSLIVNGAALTRGRRLFEARHLLEEILYLYKRILG